MLVSFCTAKNPSEDIPALLSKANKLKYAEKYEEAKKIYDEILKSDPCNKEAIKGKDDCRIMLEPVILIQHLMPPIIDPEYQELIKKLEEAKTPWDKRRAEIAIELYAVRYTGKVFSEDREKLEKETKKIIEKAIKRIEKRESAEKVYVETEREIIKKQRNAHQTWKGHGPEILKPAMKKLNEYYEKNNLPNPSKPLILTAHTSQKATKEMEVSNLIISIKNKSSYPIILLDFQFEDLKYITFSWQRAMYGSLSYDKKKNIYFYNHFAQQKTYNYFNCGLLFPGQTVSFSKDARIPKPECNAFVRFSILDDETIKFIYAPTENIYIYAPATLEKLKAVPGPKSFFVEEKAPFPDRKTIIFDNSSDITKTQEFKVKF